MTDDLRLRVARHLGWTEVGESMGKHPAHNYFSELPDWPSDDAAAVRDVVAEIVKRGREVVICTIGPHCPGWCVDIIPNDEVTAPRLSEAICRAFVEACDREAKGATS